MYPLLALALATPGAAKEPFEIEIFNQTGDEVEVFLKGLLCTDVVRGETSVCASPTIAPSGSYTYTLPDDGAFSLAADCAGRDAYGKFRPTDYALTHSGRTYSQYTLLDGPSGDCVYDVGAAPPPRRADRQSTVTVSEGFWGNWRLDVDCPKGSYADGYQLRVESSRGKGDDTALNAVRLRCDDPARTVIESHPGYWGTWGPWAACAPGAYLTGAKVKLEAKQGSDKDDTAANDVNFQCSNDSLAIQVASGSTFSVSPPPGGAWGTWGALVSCPAGQAVCGLRTRVERPIVPNPLDPTAANDDTAMNGLRLNCCSR